MALVLVATVIEGIGMGLIIGGITVELKTGGGTGHILITIGSVVIAIGALVWAKVVPFWHR